MNSFSFSLACAYLTLVNFTSGKRREMSMRTNTGCSSAILKQSSQMCFYATWVTYENHPSLVVLCLYPQSFWNLTVFKLHHLLLKGLSPNDCNFGVFC